MLAPGNYVQWKSKIKRYIDTKPNHELIHYCLKNPPYKFIWADKVVSVSEGSPETTTVRYMETYKNVSQDIRDQLNAEAEVVQISLTGIDNDIYSTVDAYPNASHIANPLALVAQQQPVYNPQNHATHYTQNSLTRSQQAATRNRGKAIVNSPSPIYDQESSMVAKDDEMSKDKEIDKLMALISLSGAGYDNQRLGNVAGARETVGITMKPKRVKDAAYHREKMLLCKQEEAGIQLNAEQADWRDDTDDESKDQELEAHYMYMAKLQEVTLDAAKNSGPIFDTEPLEKVSNNDNYNVFAIESEHPEQSKSVHDTYLIEQDKHNVIINLLNMSYDSEQIDQNDANNDLANERELLASLIEKLKCEIDDSKNRNKFLETSNKVLVEKLKGEIEDFKTKNKSLESSNNRFKEANNKLSKTNKLLYNDFKKSQAEFERRNDVEYASKVEIDYAKARGDLISYKMESQKSSNKYTQTINDLNQTISEMKKKLSAHQETISILSQQKEAQIKLYETHKEVPISEGCSVTTTERYMETYKNVSQDIRDQLNAKAKKAIKRLKLGESINVQDLETNLYWEFGKFTSQDGESLESYYLRLGNVVGARENVGTIVVQKSRIQCYNCKEFGHVARECQKPKRAKDAAYHMEKMLLHKQKETRIKLNVEQVDWRDDTDDESKDQELEAHYMYMAKLQEVTPDAVKNSGPIFDTKPVQKNDDDNDLNNEHKLLSSLIEKLKCEIDDSKNHNKFLETSNKNDDDNDLNNEHNLLSSLIEKLKCEIDDSKNRNKFLETSNKVLVEKLKGEIKDFKNKNKSLESSNNHFKEANNRLSETNKLLYNDFKKSQAELERSNDVEYASKVNDLLTGSCGTYLYSITLQDTSSPNPICLMAKATSSQSWLWHRRLSHLNFDTINLLSKNDMVIGLPKLKFVKDHLSSSLIVDDYSRYTWTYFLRSKDETPKVLIDFLILVQRGLHAQVRTVRTDKGTKFLNQTLHAYFASEGILHQTSIARTPEQNGVVERRNRTLVEAARIILSAAKVPLFFWAEAIATSCFTQNRSLEKGDACIFVGYSTQSRAYRVFNKRTRVIVETIHVNFDELPQMASDHVSSDLVSPCQKMIAKNAQVENDEFINIFCIPVQDRGETLSHYVDTSNMQTFYQHHPSKHRWMKDHPLEQVIRNPSQIV
nr:hypothetical protein [Tanacetum cinerariifolium]